MGFTPSTADPSLFLRTDTSPPPFYVLVYIDDLVFATADTEALTLVKSELQKRHTYSDQGEVRSYLGLQITRDRARRTITLTQSHMVHVVLQRFGFQFSSPHPAPLSTGHSLSAPPLNEFVEPTGPYPELVGCLMYLMTCTRPDLAYPLSLMARYVAPGRHRKVHWDAAKRVLHYLSSMSGMGLVLGGRGPVVLTGHADASWVDDSATQRPSQGYTFSLGSGSVSWRSTHSSSVLSSSCEAEFYAGAMATRELRWLTYLLTDLGEQPRLPPEHGQLRLAYVATRANTADIFTKALPPGDHQRFCTVLGLLALLFLTGLRIRVRSGAVGAGGSAAGGTGAGGAGAAGPGGARTSGIGAIGAGGVGGAGVEDPGDGGTRAGDPGARDPGARDPGAGGTGAEGAGAGGTGAGGAGASSPGGAGVTAGAGVTGGAGAAGPGGARTRGTGAAGAGGVGGSTSSSGAAAAQVAAAAEQQQQRSSSSTGGSSSAGGSISAGGSSSSGGSRSLAAAAEQQQQRSSSSTGGSSSAGGSGNSGGSSSPAAAAA
ncbi:unnamed protein product [Closterium sp. NIES-53]